MKKVLLFLILASMFNILQAQVFKEDYEYTRTTKVKISDELENNSSILKILRQTKDVHIALSKQAGGKAMFTYLKDGEPESAKHVVLNSYFDVKDFTLFGPFIYFCGSISTVGPTEAFVAYAEISDFFAYSNLSIPLNPETIKYTIINDIYEDSIYSINRIEAYYNSDSNEIVLAGIGKMRYGEPPYQVLNITDPDITFDTIDPNEYYLDFFMLYTIKEQLEATNYYDLCLGVPPIYDTANHVELFYVPTDTVGGCYYNKFADITQTDNKIYLTSVNYSNPSVPDDEYARYIDVISFDKLTRQQQVGRISLSFNMFPEYGIKSTALKNDEIAIAFTKCNTQTASMECCAFKLKTDSTGSFSVSNFSVFDNVYGKPYLLDCEYLDTTNELIVLRESQFGNIYDETIFHISMNENLSYPYTSYKYVINTDLGEYAFPWNDIQSKNPYNYTVFGGFNSELFIYDRRFDAHNVSTDCFNIDVFQVNNIKVVPVVNIPTLKQCRFFLLTPNVINGGYLFEFFSFTPIYKAFIERYTMPRYSKPIIIQECTK